MQLSDDLRVMLRPFAAYRELGGAREDQPISDALAKIGLLLLFIGSFVSLTATGRLVAFHVASAFFFWAFVPALQALAVFVALRTVAPDVPLGKALSLYFTGHGPWFSWMLLMAAIPLVVGDVYAVLMFLVRYGIVPFFVVAALGWGGLLTYACFQAGLDLPRGRAARLTAVFYLVYAGCIVGYYLVMNQIQPQFPGIP